MGVLRRYWIRYWTKHKELSYAIIKNLQAVYVERRGKFTYYAFYKDGIKVVTSDDHMTMLSMYREDVGAWIKRSAEKFGAGILRIL